MQPGTESIQAPAVAVNPMHEKLRCQDCGHVGWNVQPVPHWIGGVGWVRIPICIGGCRGEGQA